MVCVFALWPLLGVAAAEPAWLTSGAHVAYSGSGYVNLSSGGRTCAVFSEMSLEWTVADVRDDLGLLRLRLEASPPMILRGDCGWLNNSGSAPIILEAQLSVDLETRRASWRGADLGLIPFWIEGLAPGAEVLVSGSGGRAVVGRVGDLTYARVGEDKRFFKVFEVSVVRAGALESRLYYDSSTGVLLKMFLGTIDQHSWPFLKALGASWVELYDLELSETNLEFSEAGPLLNALLGGWWIRPASGAAAVASLLGLAALSVRRGGPSGAVRTPAGRVLLAILVASAALVILTWPAVVLP